jgi:hypothetical protein
MANQQLVPTPETARHVSWGFRGRRGTAARYASKNFVSCVRAFGRVNDDPALS